MATLTYSTTTLEYADGTEKTVPFKEIIDFAAEILRELQRQVTEHHTQLLQKKRVAKKALKEAQDNCNVIMQMVPMEFMVRAPDAFLEHLKGRYPGLVGWECTPSEE